MIRPKITQDSSLSFRMTCQECFCHSELAFGRGRIPTMGSRVRVVKMLLAFIYDSSQDYAGSFTILQNDMSRVFLSFLRSLPIFCHSELALGRGRIPAVIARVWISENVIGLHLWFVPRLRRILHYPSEWHVKDVFLSFWTSFPLFFVIMNELLSEEESLLWVCGIGVVEMLLTFIYDSSNENAGSFTFVQDDISRIFF